MPTRMLSRDELEALVTKALQRAGAALPAAKATARALVLAEIDGQGGHGLSRVESYAAQVRAEKVVGDAVPEVTHPRAGVVMVDAAHGFSIPRWTQQQRRLRWPREATELLRQASTGHITRAP